MAQIILPGDATVTDVVASKTFSGGANFNAIGTIAAKDAAVTEVNRYVLNNLIGDSGFESSGAGWTIGGGISSTYHKYGTKSAYVTSSNINSYSIAVVSGHIYYASGWFLTDSSAVNGQFDTSGGTAADMGNVALSSTSLPGTLTWYRLSWIDTASATSITGFRVYTVSGTPYLNMDGLCLFDLTATFGAGNEPSKAEMDTLLGGMTTQWIDRNAIVVLTDAGAYRTTSIDGKIALMVPGDDDLLSYNIKTGVEILGVTGSLVLNLGGTLTLTGTYNTSTYVTADSCRLGCNIATGEVMLIMQGGTSTSYEQLYFTSVSLPDGVTLVAGDTPTDTSNRASDYYCCVLTGVTGVINVSVNLSAINSSYDYVTCGITAAYA